MNKGTKLLINIGVSVAAGAILGILYAPDKGERTRRRITRKSRYLVSRVKDKIEENRDKLEELKDIVDEQREIFNAKMELYA